jgi:ribonuclease D
VAIGLAVPESEAPKLPPRIDLPSGIAPIVDLLRVLLKTKCEANEVAQKLVANASDLELIASDDRADVPAMHGWRRELFGEHALALKHGRVALSVANRQVKIVTLGELATAAK